MTIVIVRNLLILTSKSVQWWIMMASLLDSYPVTIQVPVAWGEMDAFQHVNNVAYFRYFEGARIAYFEEIRLLELMRQNRIGPILKSTRCNFKLALTYPDTLEVGAKVTAMQADQFTMAYAVASHRHRRIAAEGEGVLVAYDYRKKTRTAVPDILTQRVLEVEKRVKKL